MVPVQCFKAFLLGDCFVIQFLVEVLKNWYRHKDLVAMWIGFTFEEARRSRNTRTSYQFECFHVFTSNWESWYLRKDGESMQIYEFLHMFCQIIIMIYDIHRCGIMLVYEIFLCWSNQLQAWFFVKVVLRIGSCLGSNSHTKFWIRP